MKKLLSFFWRKPFTPQEDPFSGHPNFDTNEDVMHSNGQSSTKAPKEKGYMAELRRIRIEIRDLESFFQESVQQKQK